MPCFGPNWPDDTLLTATGGQVYSPATRFHSVLPDGRDTYTVKWIGVYLANRLTTAVTTRHPAGIHTVGHLRAECANRSRRHIERTLGTLTLMRVPIVASTTVSVVTTVGCRISVDSTCYWRWLAARHIPYRERGPTVDQGQRSCGCKTQAGCAVAVDCRWVAGQNVCVPALNNPPVALQGFGADGDRATVAGQYRRGAAQQRGG